MSEHRVFYITAHQLVIYWSVGSKLYPDNRFEASAAGYEEFAEAIKQYPDVRSVVLLDVIEEEYRSDRIPHVFGSDSHAIQQRKLTQLYHRTPYRCCEIQGRESHGRRDDKILFAAITNPDRLAPWMSILEKAKIPVQGIYSLSGLSRQIVKKAKITSPNVLLISEQAGNTLRQTFLQNRYVKISRTSFITAKDREEMAGTIQRESEKNKRYLNRIQVLPHNAALDVYIICRDENAQALAAQCVDSDLIHYHFLTQAEVAQRIGLKSVLKGGYCEELFIHLLANVKPGLNYGQPDDRRYHAMFQARRLLSVASVLLTVMCAGWSVATVLDAQALKVNTVKLEQEARNLEEGYKQLQTQLPKTEITPANMQTVVNIAKTLDEYKSNPQLMMSYLSEGLQGLPGVQIDEISWMSASQPGAELESADTVYSQTPDPQAAGQDGEAQPEIVQQQNFQIAIVKASLKSFDGNFEHAFREVERFAAQLKTSRHFYDVGILKQPLNIDSSSTLLMTSGKEIHESKAQFEVRAVVQVNTGPGSNEVQQVMQGESRLPDSQAMGVKVGDEKV